MSPQVPNAQAYPQKKRPNMIVKRHIAINVFKNALISIISPAANWVNMYFAPAKADILFCNKKYAVFMRLVAFRKRLMARKYERSENHGNAKYFS